MNHYEILGVPKDATPEAIKRAYQSAARQHHPDRGGNVQKMSAINIAYEVLSDQMRRLNYDQTGADRLPDIELQARDWVTREMCTWISQPNTMGDMLKDIRWKLTNAQAETQSKQVQLKQVVQRFRNRIDRMKFKGTGADYMRERLNAQLATFDAQIAGFGITLEVLTRVAGILSDYEYEAELQVYTGFFAVQPVAP